ncbi:acyltransferase family protein [Spirosoma sp. KCTC 42546]|uniref:acyltransferase family protein n=1 Tax=Spirosoma sp. KCTC 42546 TaxID=2520506 RepID=UPI001158BC27|nr:acyltransferase family protein [Spirosoma sp. KCTC 42546]QDK77598.1 acyltransferase family protein [Spirosoma sp. KCTC 42546]
MNQRNASVDLSRFLGAFSVFIAHGIYASKMPVLVLMGRWSVPFFFMVSGYYFHKSYSKHAGHAFTKTFKTLLSISLFANGFYLLFMLLTVGSLTSLANHFTLIVGTYFHLWFLTSLLLGYLVLWFFWVCKLESLLPYLSALVIVIIVVINPYHSLVGINAHPIYSRMLLSIPFLCIGFLIDKYRIEQSISKWACWLLIGMGISLQFIEMNFLSRNWQDSLTITLVGGTLLYAVGIFLLSLKLTIPSSILSRLGYMYSQLLYLYHPIINYFIFQLLITTKASPIFFWLSPLWTMSVTLPIFLLLDRVTPNLFRLLSGNFNSLPSLHHKQLVFQLAGGAGYDWVSTKLRGAISKVVKRVVFF